MKRKKLNKKFEAMLSLAALPSTEAKRKSEAKRPDGYSGKKTHQHSAIRYI